MLDLKQRFPQCKIGLSDHTMGTVVSVAAVALGATMIEKHVTMRRADGGVDSAFSLEPQELKQLCDDTRDAALAIGNVNYQRSDSEKKNTIFRRSIYAIKDIAEGEEFTSENIRIIRPGYGAAPKEMKNLLGTKAGCEIKRGSAVNR